PCPPNYLKSNVFKNLYVGIDAMSEASLYKVKINETSFEFCHYGIILRGVTNPIITENTVLLPDPNTRTIGSRSAGIYLSDCTGYKAENNTIKSGFYGIYVRNSGYDNNEIYRNELVNNVIGIQAEGVNKGLFMMPIKGLDIKCNRFSGIKCGINIGVTQPGIDLFQGDCTDNTSSAGNIFSNSCEQLWGDFWVNPDADPIHYAFLESTRNTEPICYNQSKVTLSECAGVYDFANSCPSKVVEPIIPNPIKGLADLNELIKVKQDLIDGGDTEYILSNIDGPPGKVKNLLMAFSPYLSDEVLLAALRRQNMLPEGVIKQVVVANSPVSNTVLSELGELQLPPGIITDINSSQEGVSEREVLEQEIYSLLNQKDEIERIVINYELSKDTIFPDSLVQYFIDGSTNEGYFLAIGYYLRYRMCLEASTTLEKYEIITQDDNDLKFIFTVLIKVCENNNNYLIIDAVEMEELTRIALSESIYASYAKAILSSIYQELWPLIFNELEADDSLTIKGLVFSSCINEFIENAEVALFDEDTNMVTAVTPVMTDENGFFRFYFAELLSLDTSKRYTINTPDFRANLLPFDKPKAWFANGEIILEVPSPSIELVIDSLYCQNEQILLSPSINGGCGEITYSWEIGDGFVSNDKAVNVAFDQNGTYLYNLVVIDTLNCADSTSGFFIVSSPNAFFSTDSVYCKGEIMETDSIAVNADSVTYLWVINQDSLKVLNPQYLFAEAGEYEISLTVFDNDGCTSMFSDIIRVES
ncbi:right-handed parallel beta-helix repeat-containing protein, partial [Patescibacteria group bacterium]|nr:right-handed parallel beta-helix repeat-containing protein [Patescibacteria group bacterium]